MVKEFLETFSHLVILSHSLANILSDDLLHNLAEFRLEVINPVGSIFYAFIHLLSKTFYELCFTFEVAYSNKVLLDLCFQLSDVPSVGFLRNSLVKSENTLAHVLVFRGVFFQRHIAAV